MIQQTKIKDQYRQFDSALISYSGQQFEINMFFILDFSEKRLEKIRPKNECDEDVGSLSLPNCIKVNVTNLNFVTIIMSPKKLFSQLATKFSPKVP